MRRKGRVIDTSNSRATVCFEPAESCKTCEASKLCQAAGKRQTVLVDNNVGAQVDEEVYVEQSPGIGLLSAFLLFGLPVVLALVGLIIGARWGQTSSLLIGVSGFAAGLVIAKLVDNRLIRKSLFLPRIVEIIAKEEGA